MPRNDGGGALRAGSIQLSNSPTLVGRRASSLRVHLGHGANRLIPSSETLERACGTSGASTARSGRHLSLAIDTDHPRTGHGQPFASAFRTRRINGLPLPAAPRAGALTECERVALLGPWAVRPRLPYVTLSEGHTRCASSANTARREFGNRDGPVASRTTS